MKLGRISVFRSSCTLISPFETKAAVSYQDVMQMPKLDQKHKMYQVVTAAKRSSPAYIAVYFGRLVQFSDTFLISFSDKFRTKISDTLLEHN